MDVEVKVGGDPGDEVVDDGDMPQLNEPTHHGLGDLVLEQQDVLHDP